MNKEHERLLVWLFQSEFNAVRKDTTSLDRKQKYRHFPGASSVDPLVVDGIPGDKTKAVLDAYIAHNKPKLPIMEQLWELAESFVGRGGDGVENNEGVFIQEMRDALELPRRGSGAWCSLFLSYLVHLVDPKLAEQIKTTGAPMFENNVIRIGREIDIDEVKPGQVVFGLWKRGKNNHHVRICKYIITYWTMVGGNETTTDMVRRSSVTRTDFERRLISLFTLEQA